MSLIVELRVKSVFFFGGESQRCTDFRGIAVSKLVNLSLIHISLELCYADKRNPSKNYVRDFGVDIVLGVPFSAAVAEIARKCARLSLRLCFGATSEEQGYGVYAIAIDSDYGNLALLGILGGVC